MAELADQDRLRALLLTLEAAWRRLGFQVSEYLLPGLPEEEIWEWFGEAGLSPSSEALTWWEWHGDYDSARGWRYPVPPTALGFMSIAEAISEHQFISGLFPELTGLERLIPVASIDRYHLWMHLDVPAGAASPLRAFHLESADDDLNYVIAPSLAWLVDRWVKVLDSGLCTTENGWQPIVAPLDVQDKLGYSGPWFGERKLDPLRHDPPPMEIE